MIPTIGYPASEAMGARRLEGRVLPTSGCVRGRWNAARALWGDREDAEAERRTVMGEGHLGACWAGEPEGNPHAAWMPWEWVGVYPGPRSPYTLSSVAGIRKLRGLCS